MFFRSVVLPAPFAPTMETREERYTRALTPYKTFAEDVAYENETS